MVECLPRMHKALGLISALLKGRGGGTWLQPSSQWVEAGGSEALGHPWLHSWRPMGQREKERVRDREIKTQRETETETERKTR